MVAGRSRTVRVLSVVGARPNFMKIAPFARAIAARNDAAPGSAEHILVHTGQHYDASMSDAFFRTLSIPEPDIHLAVGSGTHAEQVGRTMMAFEPELRRVRPDWVVVVGDVNATCACSITAKKEGVRVAHIEAGLRSFDMDMPEEINRMVTDRLSDLLLTPDAISDANLRREGVPEERIVQVGNIMIDTLDRQRAAAAALDPLAILGAQARPGQAAKLESLSRTGGAFALLTLHRPSNVDSPEVLAALANVVSGRVAAALPVVWILHPRTQHRLERAELMAGLLANGRVIVCGPAGYLEMLRLNMAARVMLTDSGGLQEECCVLGTPCLTLRDNTERPVTLTEHGGVCLLAGNDPARVGERFEAALRMPRKPTRPPLWDGHAAERAVDAILRAS